MNTIKKLVIAGFPGVGKSTLYKSHSNLVIRDSDSSKFDKKHFPQNYIDHIKTLLSDDVTDVILVSTHAEVLKALADNGIDHVIVVPDADRKTEFIENYINRGNTKEFVQLLNDNWDNWIDNIVSEKPNTFVLGSGKYLSDVLDYLVE